MFRRKHQSLLGSLSHFETENVSLKQNRPKIYRKFSFYKNSDEFPSEEIKCDHLSLKHFLTLKVYKQRYTDF